MKGKFFGKLRSEYIDGTREKLINPRGRHQFGFLCSDGEKIVPPNRFITDFASIPRVLHSVLPPRGRGRKRCYGMSAVIHDWLYWQGRYSKKTCDNIFKEGMDNSNVYKIVVFIMYQAVNWFGFMAWNKLRKGERE